MDHVTICSWVLNNFVDQEELKASTFMSSLRPSLPQKVGPCGTGPGTTQKAKPLATPKVVPEIVHTSVMLWLLNSDPKLGIRGISSNLSSRRSGAFWPLSNCYRAPVATLALGTGCRGEVKSEMVLRGSPLHTWFLMIFGLNFLIL